MTTPTHPDQPEEILNSALGLPAGQRGAFIAMACGEDVTLLATVQELLSAKEAVPTDLSGSPDAGNLAHGHWEATVAADGSGRKSDKPDGKPKGISIAIIDTGNALSRSRVDTCLPWSNRIRMIELETRGRRLQLSLLR